MDARCRRYDFSKFFRLKILDFSGTRVDFGQRFRRSTSANADGGYGAAGQRNPSERGRSGETDASNRSTIRRFSQILVRNGQSADAADPKLSTSRKFHFFIVLNIHNFFFSEKEIAFTAAQLVRKYRKISTIGDGMIEDTLSIDASDVHICLFMFFAVGYVELT